MLCVFALAFSVDAVIRGDIEDSSEEAFNWEDLSPEDLSVETDFWDGMKVVSQDLSTPEPELEAVQLEVEEEEEEEEEEPELRALYESDAEPEGGGVDMNEGMKAAQEVMRARKDRGSVVPMAASRLEYPRIVEKTPLVLVPLPPVNRIGHGGRRDGKGTASPANGMIMGDPVRTRALQRAHAPKWWTQRNIAVERDMRMKLDERIAGANWRSGHMQDTRQANAVRHMRAGFAAHRAFEKETHRKSQFQFELLGATQKSGNSGWMGNHAVALARSWWGNCKAGMCFPRRDGDMNPEEPRGYEIYRNLDKVEAWEHKKGQNPPDAKHEDWNNLARPDPSTGEGGNQYYHSEIFKPGMSKLNPDEAFEWDVNGMMKKMSKDLPWLEKANERAEAQKAAGGFPGAHIMTQPGGWFPQQGAQGAGDWWQKMQGREQMGVSNAAA